MATDMGMPLQVGLIVAGSDCDDSNLTVNPSATDLSGDGIDQNCDAVDGTDADGDGYASSVSGGLTVMTQMPEPIH